MGPEYIGFPILENASQNLFIYLGGRQKQYMTVNQHNQDMTMTHNNTINKWNQKLIQLNHRDEAIKQTPIITRNHHKSFTKPQYLRCQNLP